jgi:hypothetical protein
MPVTQVLYHLSYSASPSYGLFGTQLAFSCELLCPLASFFTLFGLYNENY